MPASKSPQKRGVLVFGWGFLVMLTAYCENQILNSILARLSGKLREKTPCLRGMQGIWGNRKGWRILVHSIGNSQLNFIPSLCYHSPPLEVSLKIIIIINIELLYKPAIPQLGINPEKTIIQKNTSTPTFTAAQFIIAKIRKQPKCSLIHEWAQKLWYILSMQYSSATKKDKTGSFLKTRVNLETAIQWQVSHQEKSKYHTLPVAQMVKNLPVMQGTKGQSLRREDPLQEEMATHSSILARRVPWTEEPGGQQSVGWQRVGNDWATDTHKEYMWNLGKWYGSSYLQKRNTDTVLGKKHMDTKRKSWGWEGGMNQEIGIDTETLLRLCMKEIFNENLGTPFSALWGPEWEGNPKERGYVYTCSWFTLLKSGQTVETKDRFVNLLHCCYSVMSDSLQTPWTAAHQVPLSMGFSRKEYWSGLPFSPPGHLPDPGIKQASPASVDSYPSEPPLIKIKKTTTTKKKQNKYQLCVSNSESRTSKGPGDHLRFLLYFFYLIHTCF